MIIRAGYKISFQCQAATPMLLQLNVHPSREADLLSPDEVRATPALQMESYLDLFGNRVTRLDAPAGPVHLQQRLHDPRQRPPGRNAAGRPADADQRAAERGSRLSARQPLLRQRQSGRLRLVAIPWDRRRGAARAGDLRFRP